MESAQMDNARLRIRVEYIEMPDLKLTCAQARRLWNLPQEICDAALASLVGTGFLWRTHDGRFLRRGLGRRAAGQTPSDSEPTRDAPSDPYDPLGRHERDDPPDSPNAGGRADAPGRVGDERWGVRAAYRPVLL